MKLHEAIILRRREKGLSQMKFAELAGVARATLCRIEAGRHEPRFNTALRMLRLLGIPSEIIDLKGETPREIELMREECEPITTPDIDLPLGARG